MKQHRPLARASHRGTPRALAPVPAYVTNRWYKRLRQLVNRVGKSASEHSH